MSAFPEMPKLERLEAEPLWKEANDLAEHMYGLLEDMPEEEKWISQAKLRSEANELMLAVAIALSNVSPTSREYDWNGVRRHLGAVKTIYRFAGRQKLIPFDPEVMVRLDKLASQIDDELTSAVKQSQAFHDESYQQDMRPWLEKYKIWQELNSEKEK